eukprot:154818-Amorphochlora_amoeboformis.AAC.2
MFEIVGQMLDIVKRCLRSLDSTRQSLEVFLEFDEMGSRSKEPATSLNKFLLPSMTTSPLVHNSPSTRAKIGLGDMSHLTCHMSRFGHFHMSQPHRRLQPRLGYGSDPDSLAKGVKKALPYAYDAINLNCGCPSDKVQPWLTIKECLFHAWNGCMEWMHGMD